MKLLEDNSLHDASLTFQKLIEIKYTFLSHIKKFTTLDFLNCNVSF